MKAKEEILILQKSECDNNIANGKDVKKLAEEIIKTETEIASLKRTQTRATKNILTVEKQITTEKKAQFEELKKYYSKYTNNISSYPIPRFLFIYSNKVIYKNFYYCFAW